MKHSNDPQPRIGLAEHPDTSNPRKLNARAIALQAQLWWKCRLAGKPMERKAGT